MSDTLFLCAVELADAGLPVLPIEERGKAPLGGQGKDHATTDAATIQGWFDKWPDANIGVRPPQGFVVLDVDPRNGGDETLAVLQERHGALPDTLTAATGSGGWHIWFSYTGLCRGILGPGVDIKTNTGYVVAPPSIHECGGPYQWASDAPTAPAPRWLRPLLAPPLRTEPTVAPGRAGNASGLARTVENAGAGNRNNALHWAACRAWETTNVTALKQLNAAAQRVGLTEREASATIASARRTVQGDSQ